VIPRIALEDVWLRQASAEVLSGLSLEITEGEVLALLGPSAAGKTTALRMMLGLVAPGRGTVRLRGEVVSAGGRILRPPEERNLAVVFQDLALWPHLTVHGNLAFGLAARGVRRTEREARIAAMLGRVDLAASARRRPGELSGGERQRVAIARALVLEPDAVLLDEPLTNLDVGLRGELLGLFAELLRERRATAVYVTHDPREAARLGDRIAVLERGRIVQVGTFDALRASPATAFVRAVLEELARGTGG